MAAAPLGEGDVQYMVIVVARRPGTFRFGGRRTEKGARNGFRFCPPSRCLEYTALSCGREPLVTVSGPSLAVNRPIIDETNKSVQVALGLCFLLIFAGDLGWGGIWVGSPHNEAERLGAASSPIVGRK